MAKNVQAKIYKLSPERQAKVKARAKELELDTKVTHKDVKWPKRAGKKSKGQEEAEFRAACSKYLDTGKDESGLLEAKAKASLDQARPKPGILYMIHAWFKK